MTDICLVHGGDLAEPSGGTDRVSAFAAGLAARGWELAVVVPTPSGSIPDRLDPVEIIPVDVGTRGVVDQPLRAVSLARTARTVANRRNALLQIEHATLAGASELLGVSFDVLDMHDLSFQSPLYGELPFGSVVQQAIRHIEGRALAEASELIVVSERMADLVAAEWGLSREAVTVIPNGYFSASIEPYRDTDTVGGRVVFLGTLHPKVDIEAFGAIAELPEVSECVVVGDGPQRETLEASASRVDDLRVTGRLPDDEAFSLVRSAAVAINPQHASDLQAASSPVKLYYYAALGRPMVLTEGPELVTTLADAGAATAVPPGGGFVAAVQQLLADRQRRDAMSDAARHAGAELTWQRRVDTLTALYSTVIRA